MGAEIKTKAVRLPQSGSDFFTELKAQKYLAQFAAGTMRKKASFPLHLQQMVNYSYPGLIHGRPLNKVMIVLVGQSGAGKSTTINYLFNDEICETSDCASETRKVTEYGKELCATDEDLPSVMGFLSFVDPPGALDTDHTKEILNLATITKFRDQHPDLQPRKGVLSISSKIRENVYPNLVLMVIHAADNRMRGPDSNLRKCLKALDKYKLLDRLYPNLMIVVTHSMTMGRKKYKQETARITRLIQEAVFIVLRLRDVQVVFVENRPDDYDIDKAEDSDFYLLPDGQLSHYNLINAMEKHFDRNGDVLGKLLCGWYFADDCPEKQNAANVLNSVEHTELSEAELSEALQVLASLDAQLSVDEDIIPPKFNFHYIGQGYCPKTEKLKNILVYQEADTVRAKLLDVLYTVPKCFQLKEEQTDHFFQLTFETKEIYESNKSDNYCLEDNVELKTCVDPTGRWVKPCVNNQGMIRAVYEKRMATVSIPNPESQVKNELMKELTLLPPTYNQNNSLRFHEFFLKWGSHFVQESWMGGSLTADCPVDASTYNDQKGQEIFRKIRTAFSSIISLEKKGTGYRHSFDGSNDEEIQNCSVAVDGGDPLQVAAFTDLTAVRFTDWAETVKWYPVELEYSFKLCPYYTLVKDARREALTQATNNYLDGTMGEYIPPQTPVITYGKPVFEHSNEPPALRPTEIKAAVQERKSIPITPTPEIPGIKRNKISKDMVNSAKLNTQKTDEKCVIL